LKKYIFSLISLIICITASSCSKEGDAPTDLTDVPGILTQVRLGMSPEQILKLQENQNLRRNENVILYYDSDTVLWCVSTDTELMELNGLIDADNMFYHVDDSIITYYFSESSADKSKLSLSSFSQEVYCLIDYDTANKYFSDKVKQLELKHGGSAVTTLIGTKDIDSVLTQKAEISCNSYTVDVEMSHEYDTVDGVSDYYGKYFIITITEKVVKDPVSVTIK